MKTKVSLKVRQTYRLDFHFQFLFLLCSGFFACRFLLVLSLGSRRGVVDEGVELVPASSVASPERSATLLSILPVVELG
jgi:hypothetical protein